MSVSAPTLLASYYSTANVTTSGPVAVGASVAAGATLYIVAATGSATTVLGVSDTKGNTWTQAGSNNIASGAAGTVLIWYSNITTPLISSDTVTVTRTVSGGLAWNLATITGVDQATPIGNGGTVGTGGSTTATTSLTTTALASVGVGDLIVMATMMGTSYSSATAGSGYTILTTGASTGGTNPRAGTSEYQIAPTATSYTPTGTLGSGQPYSSLSLVFKASVSLGVSQTITAGGTVTATAGLTHPTLAEIGDSLTFRANANDSVTSRETTTRARFVAAGYSPASIYWKGVGGKSMVGSDSTGTTTMQNITSAIAQLGSPIDRMVIALGTNDVGSSDGTFTADMNTVLTAAQSAGVTKLIWVNLAFKSSVNTNALHFNPIVASTMAAFAVTGYRVVDWASYVHNGRDETGLWNSSDGTHMTTDGYQLRDEYIIAQLAESAVIGSTSAAGVVRATVDVTQTITAGGTVTAVAAAATGSVSGTITAGSALTRVLGAVGGVTGTGLVGSSLAVGFGAPASVGVSLVAGSVVIGSVTGQVQTAYVTAGSLDYAMLTLGATLHFSALLYDSDPAFGGVLANASGVTLTITLPDGSVSSPTVTNPPGATGTYQYDLTGTTLAGRYVGRWIFTMPGGVTASYVEQFDVAASDPGYLMSLATAKAHLSIPQAVTTYDGEILEWLTGITSVIEYYVGVCVPRQVIDYAQEGWVIRLGTAPVLSLTSIVPYLNAGRTYTAAECRVSPDGRVVLRSGLPFSYGPFEITYQAGRNPVPWNIIQAAKIILGHLWETQRGSSGLPLQGTDDTFLPEYGYATPNRAVELLRPDDRGPGVG